MVLGISIPVGRNSNWIKQFIKFSSDGKYNVNMKLKDLTDGSTKKKDVIKFFGGKLVVLIGWLNEGWMGSKHEKYFINLIKLF